MSMPILPSELYSRSVLFEKMFYSVLSVFWGFSNAVFWIWTCFLLPELAPRSVDGQP